MILVVTNHSYLRVGHHTPAAPLPAWLDNTIANMTRHQHCAATKLPQQHRCRYDLISTMCCGQVTSVEPSPAWLGIYIAPRPSCPSSAIASMTQWHCCHPDSTSTSHCDQVVPTAPSSAWLDNTVASITRHLHCAVTKSPQKRHH
jgi:hypothetical protein